MDVDDAGEVEVGRTAGKVHAVSVRLTGEDLALVDGVASNFGISRSKAIRLMLRSSRRDRSAAEVSEIVAGVRDRLAETRVAYRELSMQLQRIGINVNQITHRLHRDGGPLSEADRSVLGAARDEARNAGRRLDDGWAYLTSALTVSGPE